MNAIHYIRLDITGPEHDALLFALEHTQETHRNIPNSSVEFIHNHTLHETLALLSKIQAELDN